MFDHGLDVPSAPERTIVLGAGGFIGQALTRRLGADGWPVLCVSSGDIDLAQPDAAPRLAEILRPDDAVVMLSALTPDKGRGIGTFMANLRMAEAVSAALGQRPVAHVVYVSSDAVYPFGEDAVDESTPAAPTDLYGAMHRARELMLADAVEAPLAVLRPTLVYGGADTHNSYGPNRFRRMARTDGAIRLFGGGEETRDHVYVDDVAALIASVLARRGRGLLNLATGRSVDFDGVARLVAASFDPPAEIVHSERANPVTHRAFDVSLLHGAFPDFRFVPLEDGLRRAHAEDQG